MAVSNCDEMFSTMPGWLKTHDAFYMACVKANADEGYDSSGKPLEGVQPSTGGGSFFGIPLPGSAWWRHFLFRAAEVGIGVAIVVVGIKAFTSSSETVKVSVAGVKAANKKIGG